MFLVGLTGGIATGKTTVANILREFGVHVIDADAAARKVVEPGKAAWRRIRLEFGDGVLRSGGEIDRERLGDVVFGDPEKRRRLDAITHPEVYKLILRLVVTRFLKGDQFVVLDLPLLYEKGGLKNYMYKVIVVSCDQDQQLSRLMERNGMSETEARKRIEAQMSLEEKRSQADYVVDNSGEPDETRRQTRAVYETLRKSRRHWRLRFFVFGWFVTVATTLTWLLAYLAGR